VIILDLCGGTGAWSKPYKDAGYDVVIIDVDQDVRLFHTTAKIHGILAAPPCTHLAGSGARWWAEKGQDALLESLSIVDACLRIVLLTQPKWWCLENPVGRLVHFIGKPKMYFDPCEYGDAYTKKTCLWGDFNEPVKNPVEPTEGSKMHKIWGEGDGKMLRSITPPGFSQAFFVANP